MKDVISVKRFANPSGDIVWRLEWRTKNVDGTVKRNRKNFGSKEEAIEERRKLEIAADNQAGPQFRLTRLDDQQLVDAEVAVDLLVRGGTGQNLRFAVDYFNRTWRPSSTTRTIEAAVEEFLAEKESAGLRPDSMRDLRKRLGNPRHGLLAEHAGKQVGDITASDITKLISKPEWSARSRSNERKALNNFFAWSEARGYCTNPVSAVTIPKRQKSAVGVLSLDEVRRLLTAALAFEGGLLVPNIALRLFCGLRPEEVARLQWRDIDLDAGVIHISEETSKTRRAREVKLESNTAAWLAPHFAKTPIQPEGFESKWRRLRVGAGFDLSTWVPDVCRHTAVSNHVIRYDESVTSHWAGNSVAILNSNYRRFVKKADSEVFWSLTPETVTSKVVPMPAAKAA